MENSIRGLFSISSNNFSSPIAESTHLNGSSLHTKFNWGEGPITSRSRNSSLTRNNKNTTNTCNITGTPPKVAMSPSSQIDARTYVDIHSNGLASRIVKYHDNGTRLNRSLSMGNLYNKPGQFPVVHLKKNETQYKAKKSRNLSMTRIAAPEKSIFHGNTLSSILRSGSVVGLQKTDEEISRENRPILHPPPTESELAPTRSVLEVLKEISRKRINSDELDGTELIKKHCKELDAATFNGQKTIQSKRQRETAAMTPNAHTSPEHQGVKKRMCNYNNDIMSSLSSSNLNLNKKKMLEIGNQSANISGSIQTHITNIISPHSASLHAEKVRGCASLELGNFVQSKYTPITPLPSTPQQPSSECVVKEKSGIVSRRASEPVISTAKPKITLFNKNYDDVPSDVQAIPEPKDDNELRGIQFVKPKKSSSLSAGGTLLIEKTKKSKLALMLSGLKGELNEDDEVDASQKELKENIETATSVTIATTSTPALSTPVGISFKTTTTTATTPITLSSVASSTATEVSKTTPTTTNTLQFNVPKPISVSSSDGSGLKISTTATIASTSSSPAVVSQATTISNPMLPLTSNSNSIPILGGFDFGQNKLLALPTITTTGTLTSQPIKPITTQPPSTSTTLGTIPIPAPTTTVAVKPFTFGLPTTQSTTTTNSGFTFGSSQPSMGLTPMPNAFTNAQTSITTTSKNPPPVFGQSSATSQPTFTFGSLAESKPNTTINSLTPTTSAAAISAPLAFSFGATKSTSNPVTTREQVNTLIPAPKETFAGITTSSASQPAMSTTIPTGGFTFGGAATTGAQKSLFGSTTTTSTNQQNSTTTFSFSANKPPNAQTNTTSAFTFGSPAPSVSTTAIPAQPPTMFGSTTPVKPANTFSFGSTAPATPIKGSFSFSTTDKPAAPSTTTSNSIGGFSFNAPTASSLAAPDASKNLFGTAQTAPTPAKPAFGFGSPSTNQEATKSTLFGAPANTTTSLFGVPATTTAQSSPFTFGSSSNTNNQVATTKPLNSIFGATASSSQIGATTTSSNSIFGGQTTIAAAPQQSATFSFGASSNNQADANKPAGGFVFGSSSSIGSNVSKPVTDMNKTFVFGDGSTTITPAPAATTNLFGGSNALSNANAGGSESKLFSFGGASAAAPASNNAFGASRQAVNQSPVFNFGTSAAVPTAQAPTGNLFAPQPAGTQQTMMGTTDRPIRKAMRRLHKT